MLWWTMRDSMRHALTVSIIRGLMFGLEYSDDVDDGVFCVVLDLGLLRFCYYRGPEEAFE